MAIDLTAFNRFIDIARDRTIGDDAQITLQADQIRDKKNNVVEGKFNVRGVTTSETNVFSRLFGRIFRSEDAKQQNLLVRQHLVNTLKNLFKVDSPEKLPRQVKEAFVEGEVVCNRPLTRRRLAAIMNATAQELGYVQGAKRYALFTDANEVTDKEGNKRENSQVELRAEGAEGGISTLLEFKKRVGMQEALDELYQVRADNSSVVDIGAENQGEVSAVPSEKKADSADIYDIDPYEDEEYSVLSDANLNAVPEGAPYTSTELKDYHKFVYTKSSNGGYYFDAEKKAEVEHHIAAQSNNAFLTQLEKQLSRAEAALVMQNYESMMVLLNNAGGVGAAELENNNELLGKMMEVIEDAKRTLMHPEDLAHPDADMRAEAKKAYDAAKTFLLNLKLPKLIEIKHHKPANAVGGGENDGKTFKYGVQNFRMDLKSFKDTINSFGDDIKNFSEFDVKKTHTRIINQATKNVTDYMDKKIDDTKRMLKAEPDQTEAAALKQKIDELKSTKERMLSMVKLLNPLSDDINNLGKKKGIEDLEAICSNSGYSKQIIERGSIPVKTTLSDLRIGDYWHERVEVAGNSDDEMV